MKLFFQSQSSSIIVLFSLFLLSACSTNNLPPMPNLETQVDEFNTHFKLVPEVGWNTFKINEPVKLSIEVIGKEAISFSYDEFNQDHELVLFILQDQQWVAVDNLAQYPEGYLVYWPAEGEPLKKGIVSVFPVLDNLNDEVLLRVVLTGKIFKDEQITDDQVVGYVDIQLKP